jgi:hypothetical protein
MLFLVKQEKFECNKDFELHTKSTYLIFILTI